MFLSTRAIFSLPVLHSRSMSSSGKRVLKGVVFDMDGTLTVPCLDFKEMRRRVGVSGRADILHEIETWSEEGRKRAFEIIKEMEDEALEKLQIMPGALELCNFLDSRQIRRGLITRNVSSSVEHFHSKFQIKAFEPALSREFRPYKPDAAPLLHICASWGVKSEEVLMVGDSAKDDIVCGRRAGAFTCLLKDGKFQSYAQLSEEEQPHFLIDDLAELKEILTNEFHLQPVGRQDA